MNEQNLEKNGFIIDKNNSESKTNVSNLQKNLSCEVKLNEKQKKQLANILSGKADTNNNKNISGKKGKEKLKNIIRFNCEDEKIVLIYKRYAKLLNDFYNKEKEKFDISKIPDIYDNIKYDIIHNRNYVGEIGYQLYERVNNLANFVMPLEYGIKIEEKINIGIKFIKPLLNKINCDLLWWDLEKIKKEFFSKKSLPKLNENETFEKKRVESDWSKIKTRFYFTSQSHLYSLLNTLLFGFNRSIVDETKDNNKIWKIFDLDYCSHIVFRLFENPNKKKNSKNRFRIEIMVSPGANNDPRTSDKNHMISVITPIILNDHLTIEEFQEFSDSVINS